MGLKTNKTKKASLKAKCKRCGRCCVVFDFKNHLWKDCKYLRRLNNDTTFCSIYSRRLDKHLGDFQICIKRNKVEYDFPKCPYNRGYNLHPAYAKN